MAQDAPFSLRCTSGYKTHLFRSENQPRHTTQTNRAVCFRSSLTGLGGAVSTGLVRFGRRRGGRMVRCVVSGCPNRMVNVNRGVFNRPPRRFFSFPGDPARVKVWLAALRQPDKQDQTEQRLICEDHFLPEDISASGVSTDAIPLMPPCLDGHLGTISCWGGESSEEEDQWAGGRDDKSGGDGLSAVKPPALDPLQQDPGAQKTPGEKTTSVNLQQRKGMIQTRRTTRQDCYLGVLTLRFLELLQAAPDGLLDLRQVTKTLHTCRQRVYDITSILYGINVLKKQSTNRVKWIGSCPISSLLWKNREKFQREVENMKLVEDMLDTLIRSCALQLFHLTEDEENSSVAYITHEDISRLRVFQEQTVIVVKAPEETKLEVPEPKEDRIQVHMKGGVGPITVLTCDTGTGEESGCFVTLEESCIKTAVLHTESSSPQSAVQSVTS